MARFKEPLSKNPNNLLSQRFTGAASVNVNDLVNDLLTEVPTILETACGFRTIGSRTTVTIGGMFNKRDYPGVIFRFPDHCNYASILVCFNKVGAILDVDAVPNGEVSSNMYHSNMSKADTGISLSGLVKKGIHGVMTDTNAVEEEEMHYSSLLGAIDQVVKSWLA